MKTRKVISAILAGACALSAMSFTATAAGDKTIKTAGSTTFKVAATTAKPEVNVSIPGTVAAVINPYGTEVTIKNVVYGADGVTSPVYTIRNFTTSSAVQVSAAATIAPGKPEDVTVSETKKAVTDEAAKETGVKKMVWAGLYGAAEAEAVNYTEKVQTGVKGGDGEDKNDPVYTDVTFGAEKDPLSEETPGGLITSELKGTAPQVTFGDNAKKAVAEVQTKLLMKLPKAEAAADSTPKKPTYDKYGYGQFQVVGAVSGSWTDKDKLTLNIVLNIGPCAAENNQEDSSSDF